jgi:hypothetical protein
MVLAGIAERISPVCLRMVESSPLFDSRPLSVNPPRLTIVSRSSSPESLESGRYRNQVLGLPNFVGIVRDQRASKGRVRRSRPGKVAEPISSNWPKAA